uniref:endo-1,4-beta-xylanase n=4 Tax=Ruminococcus flavefaciens TaxID=1265 RepID=Q9L3K3_RUMFL|nr:endoxylanase [Ruminococcus flavefaciens]
MKTKKIISGLLSAFIIASSMPAALSAYADDQQEKGNVGGYDWEMWNQNYTGTVSMKPSAGSFTCSWSGIENFLARMGKNYDSQKINYKALGDIVLSYDVEYTPRGNSYMCIYGWTRNPLMEYYIVEGWGDWEPPGNDGVDNFGTATIDGRTYKIRKSMRYNQPSIEGTKTFPQYWSVRTSSGSRNNTTNYMKDSVTVSAHFDAWSKAGLDMSGTLYEVSLNIEGYRSNGSANVKSITVGGDPPPPKEPVKADENGYYLKENFESGTGDWGARGSAKVESSSTGYDGSKGIYVSGRTNNWNGASIKLDTSTFVPGETYSLGAAVMQDSEASVDLKLTLQYTDANGKDNYDEVKTVSAAKGQWTDLSNGSYTIPADASGLELYIEAPDSLTDFYVDGAYAGVKGTKPLLSISNSTNPTDPTDPTNPTINTGIRGDVNEDGVIDSLDMIALRRGIIKIMSGGGIAPPNSDINGDGDVSVADLVALKRFILGIDKKFADPVTTTTVTTTKITTTTTTSTPATGKNLNEQIRKDMPTSVPSGAEQSSQCKVEKKTYMCKFTGKQKSCNVILPPNYDPSKKYPVMYILHGIMGSENDMMQGFGTQGLMTGLMKSGQAEEFIAVTPNMFTSKTMSGPNGINQQTCEQYDNFLYDISESLIPFIEENYPVKTGRENRAITGFSMGGREAIYIGLMRPDLFAYVGGACPAPGITPGSDTFMSHPGCMKESEMKFRDVGPEPNVFMITGGTNDGTVGTFPKQYSDILTRNGVDHVYQSIPGGQHGDNSVKPHLYTFFRYAFK